MNIIVKPYDRELCYCRPDTTWEKEGRDLYVPDGIEKMLWAPAVFARIGKAGKCISGKFAPRYYDSFGIGALLYCGEENTAFSSCCDHTSLLPMPLYDPAVLDGPDNIYSFMLNSEEIFSGNMEGVRGLLEDAICRASRRISLRIGDLVAVEVQGLQILAERKNGEAGFKAGFCENGLFDMKVIF